MTPAGLSLDAPLLLRQIHALGAIGHDAAQGGRTRIALTDADKAGRDQLVHWMRELNLDVRIDRVGNIFGILPAASPAGDGRPLMVGSHIDTVRNAGALDGCYGVLAGLAALTSAMGTASRLAEGVALYLLLSSMGVMVAGAWWGQLGRRQGGRRRR